MVSVGLLILRLGIGLGMAIGHGMPKFQKYEILKEEWHVPSFMQGFLSHPMSLMGTIIAELVCGILIAAGFFTRPAAVIFAFVMAVAAFEVHGSDPVFDGPGVEKAKEAALLYLLPAIVFIFTGPGRFSLDALISRKTKSLAPTT